MGTTNAGIVNNTLLLYFFIMVLSTFFAFVAENKKKKNKKRSLKLFFFLSFLILAFFGTFSGVGIDKENYAYYFSNSSVEHVYGSFEPGFAFLMLIIKMLTNDPKFFLEFISFNTILFVYIGIYINRKRLNLGFSTLVFSSLYYFQSYNLMRIYFAMSIMILFSFLLFEKKHLRFSLVCLICTFIHYSCIFAVLVSLVMLLHKNTQNTKKYDVKVIVLSCIIAFIVVLLPFFASKILPFFPSMFARYSSYLGSDKSNIGFGWIFNIFPFVLLLLLSKKYDQSSLNVGTSFYLVMLFLSLAGYFISTIQRAAILMSLPMIIYLPHLIKKIEYSGNKFVVLDMLGFGFRIKFKTIKLVVFTYYVAEFFIYMHQYIDIDKINDYTFIWNVF